MTQTAQKIFDECEEKVWQYEAMIVNYMEYKKQNICKEEFCNTMINNNKQAIKEMKQIMQALERGCQE